MIPIYGQGNRLSFFDFIRKRISVINLDEVLDGAQYKEPTIYKVLPPDFIHMQFGAILNDTLLVGSDSIEDGKLLFGNYKSEQYKLTEFIPDFDLTNNISSFLKPNLYLSSVAVNKNLEKVVAANIYSDQIEIYNFNGDLELIVVGDHSKQVFDIDQRSWRSPETIVYYDDVTTTDDYIFTVYYNKTSANMRDEQGYYREGLKSVVRIFDWSGKPVKELNLDRRVTSIAYDEINDRLIAVDRENMDSLVEYELSL